MFKISGLDQVIKKLDDFAKNAEALDGTHNIPINEFLTPTFVSKHTSFATVENMFEDSGFKVESQEDFNAIPDGKWDEFIRSVSSFENWKAMLYEAAKEWSAKKLGL